VEKSNWFKKIEQFVLYNFEIIRKHTGLAFFSAPIVPFDGGIDVIEEISQRKIGSKNRNCSINATFMFNIWSIVDVVENPSMKFICSLTIQSTNTTIRDIFIELGRNRTHRIFFLLLKCNWYYKIIQTHVWNLFKRNSSDYIFKCY